MGKRGCECVVTNLGRSSAGQHCRPRGYTGWSGWCQTPTLRDAPSSPKGGWVGAGALQAQRPVLQSVEGRKGGQQAEAGPKGPCAAARPRPGVSQLCGAHGSLAGVSLLRQVGSRGRGCGSQSRGEKLRTRGSWDAPDTLGLLAVAGGRQVGKARAVQGRGHRAGAPWAGVLPQNPSVVSRFMSVVLLLSSSFPKQRPRERPARGRSRGSPWCHRMGGRGAASSARPAGPPRTRRPGPAPGVSCAW